jgi:hypothetical protein
MSEGFEGFELEWKQRPKEDMYPYINARWSDEEKREEQRALYDIFHHENSYLSMTDKRKVRFCLNCKIYYKTNRVNKDVNINLCEDCFGKLLR